MFSRVFVCLQGVPQCLVPGPFPGEEYSSLWSLVLSRGTLVPGLWSFPGTPVLVPSPFQEGVPRPRQGFPLG